MPALLSLLSHLSCTAFHSSRLHTLLLKNWGQISKSCWAPAKAKGEVETTFSPLERPQQGVARQKYRTVKNLNRKKEREERAG
jgi:hypothetical protein